MRDLNPVNWFQRKRESEFTGIWFIIHKSAESKDGETSKPVAISWVQVMNQKTILEGLNPTTRIARAK
jgi:hypothetical protein